MSVQASNFMYIYSEQDCGYLCNTTEGNCSVVAIKNIYNYYRVKCDLTYKDFYELGGCNYLGSATGTNLPTFVRNLVKNGYINAIQPSSSMDIISFILEELDKEHPILVSGRNHTYMINDYLITHYPNGTPEKIEFSAINWAYDGIRKFVESELHGYDGSLYLQTYITSDCLLRDIADPDDYKIRGKKIFSIIGVSPVSFKEKEGLKTKKSHWHPVSLELYYKKNYRIGWLNKLNSIDAKRIELEKIIGPLIEENDFLYQRITNLKITLNQGMLKVPIDALERATSRMQELEGICSSNLDKLERLVSEHTFLRRTIDEFFEDLGEVK